MMKVMMTKLGGWALAFVAGGILLTGCFGGGPKGREFADWPGTPGPTKRTEGLLFQVNDMLVVKLTGTAFQTTHEEKVKEDGTITLPLIGTVVALQRDAGDLQKEIHDRYVTNNFYKTLNVVVSAPDQFYYVGGEVRVNNRQPYVGGLTVLRAIQSAGGFTDFADQRNVMVTRNNGEKLFVDCVRARQDASQDLPIYPGDTIHVRRSLL